MTRSVGRTLERHDGTGASFAERLAAKGRVPSSVSAGGEERVLELRLLEDPPETRTHDNSPRDVSSRLRTNAAS
ncbi:MAG: hypothetical protein H6682_22560 [Candidatus Eisenbacteria bacterium]|nr:hypothetical protein [Candidatus Eisenbacteria bacterium]